jgi:hypothetical protein
LILLEDDEISKIRLPFLILQGAFVLVDLCKNLMKEKEQFSEFVLSNCAKFDGSQLLIQGVQQVSNIRVTDQAKRYQRRLAFS